jgi:hypothetical protein
MIFKTPIFKSKSYDHLYKLAFENIAQDKQEETILLDKQTRANLQHYDDIMSLYIRSVFRIDTFAATKSDTTNLIIE